MSMTTLMILQIYKNICCIYRDHSVSSGGYVPQDFKRQKIVREVPDVLYVWKFLYY